MAFGICHKTEIRWTTVTRKKFMIALQIPGNKMIFIFYVKPLASIQLKWYQRNENKITVSPAIYRKTCNVLGLVFMTFRCTNVSNLFYFGMTLYMFRTVFPTIIGSSRLYILQQAYVKQVMLLLASKQTAVSVWDMPVAVCTIVNSRWWTERPSETCRVSFQYNINLRHWCIWLVLLEMPESTLTPLWKPQNSDPISFTFFNFIFNKCVVFQCWLPD